MFYLNTEKAFENTRSFEDFLKEGCERDVKAMLEEQSVSYIASGVYDTILKLGSFVILKLQFMLLLHSCLVYGSCRLLSFTISPISQDISSRIGSVAKKTLNLNNYCFDFSVNNLLSYWSITSINISGPTRLLFPPENFDSNFSGNKIDSVEVYSGQCWGATKWFGLLYLASNQLIPDHSQRIKAVARRFKFGTPDQAIILHALQCKFSSKAVRHMRRIIDSSRYSEHEKLLKLKSISKHINSIPKLKFVPKAISNAAYYVTKTIFATIVIYGTDILPRNWFEVPDWKILKPGVYQITYASHAMVLIKNPDESYDFWDPNCELIEKISSEEIKRKCKSLNKSDDDQLTLYKLTLNKNPCSEKFFSENKV